MKLHYYIKGKDIPIYKGKLYIVASNDVASHVGAWIETNIDRALCPKQKIGKTEFDNNQK